MTSSFNPYRELPYPELCGRRKDFAKVIQGAQAARKHAERNLTLIVEAMENSSPPREYEASDHAVVRYLERVAGMDISAVREAIALACAGGDPIIGDRMRGADGFLYVVNNEGFITTVMSMGGVDEEVRQHVEGLRNRRHNPRRRRARRAGEAFLAQGTSASGQDPQGLEAKPAGPVAESDAPKDHGDHTQEK